MDLLRHAAQGHECIQINAPDKSYHSRVGVFNYQVQSIQRLTLGEVQVKLQIYFDSEAALILEFGNDFKDFTVEVTVTGPEDGPPQFVVIGHPTPLLSAQAVGFKPSPSLLGSAAQAPSDLSRVENISDEMRATLSGQPGRLKNTLQAYDDPDGRSFYVLPGRFTTTQFEVGLVMRRLLSAKLRKELLLECSVPNPVELVFKLGNGYVAYRSAQVMPSLVSENRHLMNWPLFVNYRVMAGGALGDKFLAFLRLAWTGRNRGGLTLNDFICVDGPDLDRMDDEEVGINNFGDAEPIHNALMGVATSLYVVTTMIGYIETVNALVMAIKHGIAGDFEISYHHRGFRFMVDEKLLRFGEIIRGDVPHLKYTVINHESCVAIFKELFDIKSFQSKTTLIHDFNFFMYTSIMHDPSVLRVHAPMFDIKSEASAGMMQWLPGGRANSYLAPLIASSSPKKTVNVTQSITSKSSPAENIVALTPANKLYRNGVCMKQLSYALNLQLCAGGVPTEPCLGTVHCSHRYHPSTSGLGSLQTPDEVAVETLVTKFKSFYKQPSDGGASVEEAEAVIRAQFAP